MGRRQDYWSRVSRSVENASLTATTVSTYRLFAAPADRPAMLRRATYTNPTGLAQDAANHFNIRLRKNGTDIMANWSTETGQEGTIPADIHVELTLTSNADDIALAPGEYVDVEYLETGTQTLPAGLLDVEFELV